MWIMNTPRPRRRVENRSVLGKKMADHEEKRRLLRKKIAERRNQRTGHCPSSAAASAAAVRKDPATALLSMGVENPELLKCANRLANMDVTTLRKALADATTCVDAPKEAGNEDDDDDEEAPPPMG